MNAHAAHAHAGADRINARLHRHDGHFGSGAGLASNALDIYLTVVDLRHLQFQQPAQQIAVIAADQDLRPATGPAHLQHIDADLVMRPVAFAGHLLALGHNRFRPAQADCDVLAADALHRAVDYFAFATGEVLEELLTLSLTHALQDDLFGGLGSDAAEVTRRAFDHDRLPQFSIRKTTISRISDENFGPIIDNRVDDFFLSVNGRLAGTLVDLY